jgi:U32 family peptidase
MSHPKVLRPEVLAPAGDADCLDAAIHAGADAVYFGLTAFGARARAKNFHVAELGSVFQSMHDHGVRGYVTLNTLLFDHELPGLVDAAKACRDAGADAVIVQDLGVLRHLRDQVPDLVLHASTQMTCTDAASCNLAASLGAARVILARELSLQDIAAIRSGTRVPLEVFVHGALCIAYSGQCLTSEAIGGRSANRGACAQACRLPYDLMVDGALRDLGDKAYLLSPQDLEASAMVPALVKLGIRSLKIEGRLKGPAYVAATTRLYREAIDAAMLAASAEATELALRDRKDAALQVFSRGSDVGFFGGVNHQRLVEAKTCDHRGTLAGTLVGSHFAHGKTWLSMQGGASLQRGDGILVEGARATEGEFGGRIWDIQPHQFSSHAGHVVWLGPDINIEEKLATLALRTASLGAKEDQGTRRIFRTGAPKIEERILKEAPARTPLDVTVSGKAGSALVLAAHSERGHHAEIASAQLLQVATGRPLSEELIRDKLGTMEESPFQLRTLKVAFEGDLFVPVSAIKEARRELLVKLCASLQSSRLPSDHSREGVGRERPNSQDAVPTREGVGSPGPTTMRPNSKDAVSTREGVGRERPNLATRQDAPPTTPPPGLFILCRNIDQAKAAAAAGADGVMLDFLELVGTGEALRALRAESKTPVYLAPPRIRKPSEEKIDAFLRNLAPDGMLVRGLGALHEISEAATQSPAVLVGDFSLNVTNKSTAQEVLRLGLSAFTPAFDLDSEQLLGLLDDRALAGRAEVVVHHPMPLFHMEHCVFAATLSTGTDHRTCGRPCDRHELGLRDRAQMVHPVIADVGCRNTVFHAHPQSAANLVPALQARGVTRYRIELVRETPSQVTALVATYRALLKAETTPEAAWRTLRVKDGGYGVVRGSLRVLGNHDA